MPKKKTVDSDDEAQQQVKKKVTWKEHPQAKDWVFTWNNPTDDDILSIEKWNYKYIVFQKEVGENGTAHLQGFVQFSAQTRITALKKLSKRIHWEKRRGTAYQAVHYCKKPVDACECDHCKEARLLPPPVDQFEDGVLSVPGSVRSEEIARSIKESTLSQTIDRYPTAVLSMSRGMEYLDNHYTPARKVTTQCTVLYGFPRKGKTTYALKGPSPYMLPINGGKNSTEFWGSYKPREHKTVIVDEFYGQMTFTNFKRYCDGHPCEVHVKGGFKQLTAEHIVFTSNSPPHTWYEHVFEQEVHRVAFNERLTNIIEFLKDGSIRIHKGQPPWPGLEDRRVYNAFDALMAPPTSPQELRNNPAMEQINLSEANLVQEALMKEVEDIRASIRAQQQRLDLLLLQQRPAPVRLGLAAPPYCDKE